MFAICGCVCDGGGCGNVPCNTGKTPCIASCVKCPLTPINPCPTFVPVPMLFGLLWREEIESVNSEGIFRLPCVSEFSVVNVRRRVDWSSA